MNVFMVMREAERLHIECLRGNGDRENEAAFGGHVVCGDNRIHDSL